MTYGGRYGRCGYGYDYYERRNTARWGDICRSCIKDLKEVKAKLGHNPTKREYRRHRTLHMQSVESIKIHFGSWASALANI